VHPDQQVVTGEAVALELRLAGAGSRGTAAAIDIAIVYVIQFVLLIVVVILGVSHLNLDAFVALVIVTQVGVVLGYPVLFETLWRGRTPGKAVMGLRVVRDDGGPIRFRHAFVRGIIGVVLEKPGPLLGLVALVPILVTARHKRVGDLAAGTIVLQERVPGRIDVPITMPPALAGWAASLDLSGVDDALALRVRQFVSRARELTPAARAGLEDQLTAELAARVGPPPPNTPPWAILTAILAERRRRAYHQYAAAQPATAAAPTQPPRGAPTMMMPAPPSLEPATITTSSDEPTPPPSTTGFVTPT
jgi:uncharacterized RDD family membrane protein YckC